ncbi:uncharacterized protein LOC133131644 isoform X2 [Conger conger]|uniref:uncharacterized protein LOC133131644 isoform X2 n=1 Tax=Conger conger TaxID=82655 RepID=UPI002A598EA2|nr:uncharacterized protein LOC133131644 isoform X2 [Conger conger]XP_061103019.1 uncharacterized protein LOC133131644 isoform X2 [Conger conger]
MGLITEGISDCITGIESMITGEFSWTSWAINKAISIGVSLIGFGIGKLVSKGFKAAKMAVKGFGKQLKAMPKFFASQAKEGFSVTMKTNMKNVVKYTAKRIVKDTVMYGIGKAEDEIINKILEEIEKAVRMGILNAVQSNMGKEPLCSLTDSIILSHIESKQGFNELMQDDIMKKKLLAIFTELSTTALEPYSADLSWQNKLNSSISNVIDTVRKEAGGITEKILIGIQLVHMGALGGEALAAVLTLSAGKDGKLAKMQEMNPKTKDASQTVTLVYRPKSDQHPDGHYDVLINNKTVSVEKADLYHAVARGMKPDSSDDDITSAATDLRTKEAEALEKNPSLWEPFLLRDEWIKEVITASSFTAEGAAESQDSVKQNKKHFQNIMKEESEKVKEQSNAKDKDGTQKISNGHNQPSKKSILTAGHFNKDSKLSKLMFEVATGSSDHAKCQLPVVYAPHERHHKFPTAESPELKTLLAQTISKDDVEGTFKLTILGAMPTFMLERKHFLNEDMSLTRLDSFKSTFPKHATEMVNTWFKLLEGKTDLMTPDTKQTLEDWISSKGYLDPNDPARKQIMTHL